MRSNISLEEKQKLIVELHSQLDKAAKKGVIHSRTASRRKSRLDLYFNTEIEKSKV